VHQDRRDDPGNRQKHGPQNYGPDQTVGRNDDLVTNSAPHRFNPTAILASLAVTQRDKSISQTTTAINMTLPLKIDYFTVKLQ